MFVINSLSLEQQKATEKITKYNLVPVTFDVCGIARKSSSNAIKKAMPDKFKFNLKLLTYHFLS